MVSKRAKTGSIAAGASCWKATDQEPHLGHGAAAWPRRASKYYLPLFFEETATVFDYTSSKNATVVLHGDLEPAFQRWKGHEPLPVGEGIARPSGALAPVAVLEVSSFMRRL
jgi:hypothetical protein